MCSIIGCLHNQNSRNASTMMVESMAKMEYRGYDSVGIATITDQNIHVKKGTGKVAEVNQKVSLDSMKGRIGIGHTRWATHGNVTVANAHPHVCVRSEVAVVHNGIIENHIELKDRLKTMGVVFKSETDTEVIPNLLSSIVNKGIELKDAVVETISELTGQFSFIAMLKDETLIGVKNHEPLILGIGPSGYFLSSDVLGFAKHVNKVIYLDDEQFVIINHHGYFIFDFKGNRLNLTPIKLSRTFENVEKGDYEHFTLKEIHDQTSSMLESGRQSPDKFEIFAKILRNSNRIYITGSGTSYHCGLVAKYLFPKFIGKGIEAIMSSEMRSFEDCFDKNSALIAISQSGESADVLNAVALAKKNNAKILSVVNTTTSSLVKMSDSFIGLNCGYEVGVAATKSFTSQLIILYKIIEKLEPSLNISSRLNLVVDAISKILDDKKIILEISQKLKNAQSLYILGRGVHYPIAKEAALKIKELSYIHAEGAAAGELKHGPLALIDKSTYVILINPNDDHLSHSDNISNASEIKSRGAKIIGVSNENNPIYDYWIPLPNIPEIFYPIIETIPFQLMSYYLAIERGNDPDYPRNLAKCVTVK
jgi:glucosamine--fructose-6-phosphate aminotransferase (isomerizing)